MVKTQASCNSKVTGIKKKKNYSFGQKSSEGFLGIDRGIPCVVFMRTTRSSRSAVLQLDGHRPFIVVLGFLISTSCFM